MVIQDLERKIQERKSEAQRKEIGGKVRFIAQSLSTLYLKRDKDKQIVQGRELYIEVKDSKVLVIQKQRVKYKKTIFSDKLQVLQENQTNTVYQEENGEIISYVPGNWESSLNQLYREALKTNKKKQRAAQENSMSEEEEIRARWEL